MFDHFIFKPASGIKTSRMFLSSSSSALLNLPVLNIDGIINYFLILSNNPGWFVLINYRNLTSNLEISLVLTLSRNPLTPA